MGWTIGIIGILLWGIVVLYVLKFTDGKTWKIKRKEKPAVI